MNSMIDVAAVVRAVPDLDGFCSVKTLQDRVAALPRGAGAFSVETAGLSEGGLPIHHVKFGAGSLKALFVGFPHANEPIGGLTVFSLLELLDRGCKPLVEADVEWHIVPCIDPDGAILNEGWSQQEFSLANYMRNFHRQEPCDQVECSFPIDYKKLVFERPTAEAAVLKQLLMQIRPDFYFSLHNAWTGGAWYCLSRSIESKYRAQLYELLEQHHIPLQRKPLYGEWLEQFGEGITAQFSMRKFYDYLEKTTPHPEQLMQCGACSWEFLHDIKPSALTLLTELPYVKHPSDGSLRPTGESHRRLRLHLDADTKYVTTLMFEEWERVKHDLNSTSPFYRKMVGGWIESKDRLHEGLPAWPYKTRDLLFNPAYGGNMTEGERFNAYLMHGFWLLCHGYEFIRLLQVSRQTDAVRHAIERLEPVFTSLLDDIIKNIDIDKFETVDHGTLVRVQLGSGLIVINSLLETRHGPAAS